MKGVKFIILSCLIFASIVVFGNITISDFSCEQISTSSINNVTKAGATSLYNFSINVDSNFTSLNLTIPSAFAYIENSTNNTLYPNWTCSNYTQSKIKCSCDDCNVSINATDSIYLWLNLTSPDYSNETIFNFTVFVYLNQTNNATQNTTIGNDGNITFIGTVIGVENETIIEKGNIPVDVYNILDSFAGINLSASDSVQLILRNYGNGNTNKTYNMSSITANGNTQSNNFSASIYTGNLEDGAYNISIYAKDTLGNYRYSNTSYYFNVTAQPDLIIDSLNWTSVYGDNCPYSTYEGNYTNFTINLSIKNNGTADLVNTTTILFEWDSLLITQNITSLSVGSSTMLNYTIKGCPLNVSYGVHTITANLDSYSNQTEKDESNNLYTEFLYIGYNVTVLNISHSVVAPGENITVSVKVLYGNGSAVDDLSDTDDFKIYDKWNSGSFIYFNQIKSLDTSQNTSGIYILNYTVNDSRFSNRRVAKHGTHNINISIENDNYLGWDDSGNTYTINAPDLEVRFDGVETSPIVENGIDRFYLKFRNTGNVGINNIYIKIQTNHSDSRIDSTESGSYTYNYYTCTQNTELIPGAESQCILYLKGINAGTYRLEFKYAYGTSTEDGLKYNATNDISSSSYYKTIRVSESSSSSSNDDSSSSSSSTTTVVTTSTPECTTSSGCSSKEFCNSLDECQTLNCEENQLISNHRCVDINILTICNDIYHIKQGKNITIPFYLNSTKYKLSSVYLDTVKPSNYNETIAITPSSQTLIKNELIEYNITLSVPENAVFKTEYFIQINVKKGTDKLFATKNITLVASGGEVIKNQISQNIKEYGLRLKEQIDSFEKIKSKLNEEEQDAIQARTDKLNQIITEIQILIEEEQYIEADEKIEELTIELKNLNDSLSSLKEVAQKKSNMFRIYFFVLIVIFGIVGLGAYLFLPEEKGYIPNKGFIKKSKRKEFEEKVEDVIEDIKEKLSKFVGKKEENPLKNRIYKFKKKKK